MGYAIESRIAIGGNAKFIFKVERSSAARQLDDVGNIGDGLERAAVLSLHQACDVLLQHQLPEANGDGLDELLAAEEAGDVGIIKDVVRTGKSESGPGDYDGLGRGSGFGTVVEFVAFLEDAGKHAAEFDIVIAVHRQR